MITKQELVDLLRVEGSMAEKAIVQLSDKSFARLMEVFDPSEDELIHVCEEYASINRGGVGTHGTRYDLS